jgi:hypothetical protein
MSDLTGALAHKLVRGSEIFPLMSAWGHVWTAPGRRVFTLEAPPCVTGRPMHLGRLVGDTEAAWPNGPR